MGKTTLAIATLFLFAAVARSADDELIPADKSQLEAWFKRNVGQKELLDPATAEAESNPTVITVRKDGSGKFKTVLDALNSVPVDNKHRVVIDIGPGSYYEKIKIERNKPFITFYGSPSDMPTLVFDGTAAKYTTVESATLIVESAHFVAANLKIVNSAPRPDGVTQGAQAAALRIGGDSAAFYNCKFLGFQDTICDDSGRHLFNDCYIEGTVDFICGSGQSLYLNTELHVIPGERMAFITAQARKKDSDPDGYMFVHCTITGAGQTAYLGRPWYPYARVVYAFTDMSDVVNPAGWTLINDKKAESTVFFGEFGNKGPGAAVTKREPYGKKLTDAEATPFISLGFIGGSKWLLPPPKL